MTASNILILYDWSEEPRAEERTETPREELSIHAPDGSAQTWF